MSTGLCHRQPNKYILSNGPDKKESTKPSENIRMQRGATCNFAIVSTMVLIGLNIKFYEIFAKQHVY